MFGSLQHANESDLIFVILSYSDTVGRSGIFCAASNAIEQCKTEGLVDVFQATKAVRMHKPGAVTTLVSNAVYLLLAMNFHELVTGDV